MARTNCQYALPFHPDRQITVVFDGGQITSDAGLALLYSVDRSHGLSRGLSGCLQDKRGAWYVRHSLIDLTTQRVAF